MKKLLFIAVLLLAGQWASAQGFKFGIKLGGGATTASLKQTLVIPNENTGVALTFTEGNARMNFHAGFAGRLTLSDFYVQPELYFSSISNEISFSDLNGSTTVAQNMTRLDIPILAGIKMAKRFRIQIGPVASLALDKQSGVKEQIAAKLGVDVLEDSGSFAFGYQLGAGIDVGSRLSIDVKYESNLNWFGSSITVNNKDYDFDMRSRQVLLSLGLWF